MIDKHSFLQDETAEQEQNQGRRQQLAAFPADEAQALEAGKLAHQRIGKHRGLAESLLQPPQIRRTLLGAERPDLQPGLFQQAAPFPPGAAPSSPTRRSPAPSPLWAQRAAW